MEVKDMQRIVDEWISRFEEGYWAPTSMMLRLTEELGELAREINHLYGEKPKKPEEAEGDLALELADILFIIISMANSLDIDIEDAFKRTMQKYYTRDANRWTPKNSDNSGKNN